MPTAETGHCLQQNQLQRLSKPIRRWQPRVACLASPGLERLDLRAPGRGRPKATAPGPGQRSAPPAVASRSRFLGGAGLRDELRPGEKPQTAPLSSGAAARGPCWLWSLSRSELRRPRPCRPRHPWTRVDGVLVTCCPVPTDKSPGRGMGTRASAALSSNAGSGWGSLAFCASLQALLPGVRTEQGAFASRGGEDPGPSRDSWSSQLLSSRMASEGS